MTSGPFVDEKNNSLEKPSFLFGDASPDPENLLEIPGEFPWIFKLGDFNYYVPAHKRHFPLLSFREIHFHERKMEWNLTPSCSGVMTGKLQKGKVWYDTHSFPIRGLMPGLRLSTIPAEEKPAQIPTFLNRFASRGGNYPGSDFRMPGWIYSVKTNWWSKLSLFMLENYAIPLKTLGLYEAIRGTCHGFIHNPYAFYGLLEMYCTRTGTFFTPVGELGLALHEMGEISALPMGDLPYEEYFPCDAELDRLSKKEKVLHDTYRELMCHFCICRDLNKKRGTSNLQMVWAEYLFHHISERSDIKVCPPVTEAEVKQRMKDFGKQNMVLKEDVGTFKEGNVLLSYHLQAKYPLSTRAIIAGFLSLWLKKCVVPSGQKDHIAPTVLFPAVELVFKKPLGLLPAMVCCIQNGLRTIAKEFCHSKEITKDGEVLRYPQDGPNPRVELPYTYLMAWFVSHCPSLMKPGPEPAEGIKMAYVQRFEFGRWESNYLAQIRKIVGNIHNYSLYICFPQAPNMPHGAEFVDVGDRSTKLSTGPFHWLVNIRPSHLMYRMNDTCILEPYFPSRFARQFGYDQLYVGNPNQNFSYEGSLIDGARAWKYFVMGCTNASFNLPSKSPDLYTSAGFCNWYFASNTIVSPFNLNSSCLKKIQERGRRKRSERGGARVPGAKEMEIADQMSENIPVQEPVIQIDDEEEEVPLQKRRRIVQQSAQPSTVQEITPEVTLEATATVTPLAPQKEIQTYAKKKPIPESVPIRIHSPTQEKKSEHIYDPAFKFAKILESQVATMYVQQEKTPDDLLRELYTPPPEEMAGDYNPGEDPYYMVEGEAEEHTEELEVQQPPATTSAPAKKMTVILSASSSKTSSKKQPSTAEELAQQDPPTTKEQVIISDPITVGEQSSARKQIITKEPILEKAQSPAEAPSTAEKSTEKEPATKVQAIEKEQPATEEIPASIGSVIPEQIIEEQITEESVAKEQVTEVEQPATEVPPIPTEQPATKEQILSEQVTEEHAAEEQSTTSEQVVAIEQSPPRMPAALIAETLTLESEAGPSHLPVGKERILESTAEQIEEMMEISDEERELAAQEKSPSPDSTDRVDEELFISMIEVFYQSLKSSLTSLLKNAKIPFGMYKKVLTNTLDNIRELGGADKVGPYEVLLEDYEKKVLEWHTMTERSLGAWTQDEIGNIERLGTVSRLQIKLKLRDAEQALQKLKTRENNIKSDSEFGEQELKNIKSRISICSETIRKQEEVISKAQAKIESTQKFLDKLNPEAASLEGKVMTWHTELTDIQIAEHQRTEEIAELHKELEQFPELTQEEIRKQAKAQAVVKRAQELAKLENQLREYVENPL